MLELYQSEIMNVPVLSLSLLLSWNCQKRFSRRYVYLKKKNISRFTFIFITTKTPIIAYRCVNQLLMKNESIYLSKSDKSLNRDSSDLPNRGRAHTLATLMKYWNMKIIVARWRNYADYANIIVTERSSLTKSLLY